LFFFQAEDGIRFFHVTGIQTCALPIYLFIAAGSVSSTVINSNVEVRGNLEIIGSVRLFVSTGASGDYLINGDLILDKYQLGTASPSIRFQNFGVKRSVEIRGDIFIRGSGAQIYVISANTTPTVLEHDFIAWKDILQESGGTENGLKFYTYSSSIPHNQRINLILR